MAKRFLCLFLALSMAFPALATSDAKTTHNESFYQQIIASADCMFDVTDALSLDTPEYTATQTLMDQQINASVISVAKTLSATDPLKTAEVTLLFVQKEIAITDAKDAPIYAADVLAAKQGSIHGANNLLLALLHANNLPAIRTVGQLSKQNEFNPNATVNHAWCEVLIKNQWYILDLTQEGAHTTLPESHMILRRGPIKDSNDFYFEEGFRYNIKNGGAQICGVEQIQDLLTLDFPALLGGLPVLSIAEEAFAETTVVALSFPETLQQIGRKAFFHSTVPANIALPASVTNIEEYAFSYLNGLYAISVAESNPIYVSEEGILYSKDQTTLWVYPHEKREPSFVVPKSVALLYCTCFSGNPYLTEITLTNPDVKAMTYTFYGCRLNLLGEQGSAIEARLNDGGLTEYLTYLPQTTAEQGSLMHFVATGASPQFEDVAKDAWFYSDLDSVYRQGLLLGISDNLFGTDSSVTLAQAITMSVRIRLRYQDNGTLPQAEADALWYQPALDKAFENQWFVLPDLSDLDRPATRGEFAQILAGALPQNALPQRTTVNEAMISDLPVDADVREAILTLYRAGILAGNPDGSFQPESTITRAEAAAILARLTDITRRLYFNERI